MNARWAELFIAPAPVRRASAPPPGLVGVLAAPVDLAAIAGGVAAGLRGHAAVVCSPQPPAPRLATPAARALARRLRGQDLEAVAAGTLCHADLGEDPLRVMWRAAAVAPTVVALPGRDVDADELLAQADLLLLAAPPGAYADLALASLATLGPPVALIPAPTGLLARRAAALGLTRITPMPESAPA